MKGWVAKRGDICIYIDICVLTVNKKCVFF